MNALSPGLALLCASGAVLAAAGLSQLSSGTVVALNQPMRMWTALSAFSACFLAASAALATLWHSRDAFRRAMRGLLWAIPFIVIVAIFLSPLGSRFTDWLTTQSSILRISAYSLSAVVGTISLCATTEFLVTAFQRAIRPSGA